MSKHLFAGGSAHENRRPGAPAGFSRGSRRMGRAFFSILNAARHHASAGALAPPSCRSTHFRVTAGRASAWGLITQQRHRQRRRPRHRPPHLIPGAHQVSLEGDGLILSRLLEAWINRAKVFLKGEWEQGVAAADIESLSTVDQCLFQELPNQRPAFCGCLTSARGAESRQKVRASQIW